VVTTLTLMSMPHRPVAASHSSCPRYGASWYLPIEVFMLFFIIVAIVIISLIQHTNTYDGKRGAGETYF
jgi:hypothetical protein